MSNLKIFKSEEFGTVRVILRDEEPWFVAKDVADILGYRMASDMTRILDDDEKDTHIVRTHGGAQKMTIINESGLYNAILRSKKPFAKQFRKWITSEVLPTIRKTGGYVNNEDLFIETYLPMVDENTKILFKQTLEVIRQQNDKITQLNEKIEKDTPLVEFANQLTKAPDNIKVGEFAKILCDNDFNIGEKRLFKYLRDNKILKKENVPYQAFIDRGYFVVREGMYKKAGEVKLYQIALVTPKGQKWLFKKIKNLTNK